MLKNILDGVDITNVEALILACSLYDDMYFARVDWAPKHAGLSKEIIGEIIKVKKSDETGIAQALAHLSSKNVAESGKVMSERRPEKMICDMSGLRWDRFRIDAHFIEISYLAEPYIFVYPLQGNTVDDVRIGTHLIKKDDKDLVKKILYTFSMSHYKGQDLAQ